MTGQPPPFPISIRDRGAVAADTDPRRLGRPGSGLPHRRRVELSITPLIRENQ